MVDVMIPDSRLERIEEKLDKLSDTIADLARIEERILSVFKRLDRHEKRLDDQEDDLREISNDVLLNSKSVKGAERLMWIAISAGASLFVYIMR